MKRNWLALFIVLATISATTFAQNGGSKAFQFLNTPNTARIVALGGNQVGLADNDLNLTFHNPAMLTDTLNNHVVFNYAPYLSDISMVYAGYAMRLKNYGNLSIAIHHMGYGTFQRTNENDETTGTFSASEQALMLTYSRKLTPRITGGLTLKPILAQYDTYQSTGIATDMGFSYISADRLFSAGVVLRNFGSQIKTFDGVEESLPTDLQIGFSTKLQHAPFRFSATLHQLLDWDMDYSIDDSQNGSALTPDTNEKIGGFDKLMRHMVFGVEFTPGKSFYLAAGYNHRRRQELKLAGSPSTVGYSWGFGFRVYKFRFAYGSARYHLAGSTNHFSLSANLSELGL
jgi:hypothetical protein